MKRFPLVFVACGFLLAALGCGHVDLTPEGDPNRVLTGTVNVRMNLLPPPDAEVVVRLIEPPDVTAAPTTAARNDMVIGENGTRERPENVVAEQVIRGPAAMPVPFRIDYRATDAQLRHGLNVEARISWGGHVRFRTVEAQAITLGTATAPQTVWVEAVR